MSEKIDGSTAHDPALEIPEVYTEPGRKYADDTRAFQGIPGIERAPNGRLWATWYGGGEKEGPENYVLLNTSGDDGATWSAPKLVIDVPGDVRAFDPCLWHDPLGRLWLFWAQGHSHWDGRAGVWAVVTEASGEETPAWSEPRRLCDGIMMNKPIVASNGNWLLPVSIWDRPANSENEVYRFDMGDLAGSNVICSEDQGATFSLLGQVHVPESACDEHMLIERRDGSLWMLVRTRYGIGESTSTDGGVTWSEGGPSAVQHIPAARFFIRRLRSGRLLLVKHNPPNGKSRSHLTAFLSDDDGLSWHGGLILDERDTISYPDGVETADGTLYIIYDYSRHDEKQILMAVFNEEDVVSGAWASPAARQRVLINQATGRRAC